MKTQDNLVHPEDSTNLTYWTKKWGISIRQLNDAILYTGSLNPARLKEYLTRDNRFHAPFFGITRFFRSKRVSIH